MPRLKDVAAEFAASFETATRAPENGGAEFVRLKDGAPEWMTAVIREAHDGGNMLPDDWRYRMIRSVADAISEALNDGEDPDDVADERIDGLVPVYNTERAAWLASNVNRGAYVEEARGDCAFTGGSDIWEQLGVGIFTEYREIWGAVFAGLRKQAEG